MRYVCQICGYVYDDSREKIPFAELPEDWKCPLCGALKADFKAEEPVTVSSSSTLKYAQTDLKKLSAGQLAAVCSNLSRGCEKQYKPEEAELFRQLAEYFTANITPVLYKNISTIIRLYRS